MPKKRHPESFDAYFRGYQRPMRYLEVGPRRYWPTAIGPKRFLNRCCSIPWSRPPGWTRAPGRSRPKLPEQSSPLRLARMKGTMVHEVETAIPLPVEEIAEICRRRGVVELAVFGSILREDFGPKSDVDFLARFEGDDLGPWMSRLQELERDLGRLLGRSVDVVDWKGVERSRNPYRRHGILAGHKLLYAA